MDATAAEAALSTAAAELQACTNELAQLQRERSAAEEGIAAHCQQKDLLERQVSCQHRSFFERKSGIRDPSGMCIDGA